MKVCGKLNRSQKSHSKCGFGIVEVLIAAAVLGFLYMAILNLQSGNRDALLRIRGRDGATEVAQNLIDSLGTLGIARLTDENLVSCGTGCLTLAKIGEDGTKIPDTIVVSRKWEGQPGIVPNTMTVEYKAVVTVSPNANYLSSNTTQYSDNASETSEQTISHVYAKRLDVKVNWRFKQSTQSITVSGVIR